MGVERHSSLMACIELRTFSRFLYFSGNFMYQKMDVVYSSNLHGVTYQKTAILIVSVKKINSKSP